MKVTEESSYVVVAYDRIGSTFNDVRAHNDIIIFTESEREAVSAAESLLMESSRYKDVWTAKVMKRYEADGGDNDER